MDDASRAEALHQKIASLLEKIRQQEDILRPPGPGREGRIWKGLVHYANADLSSDAAAFESLLKVIYELTPELAEFLGDDKEFHPLRELIDAFPLLAIRYQENLRNLLLWLCKPKSHPELRDEALRFLEVNAHGEKWRIDYTEDPIADEAFEFDEERESPFLYFIKEIKCASIMAPICKFIFGYVDDPPKSLPIRVCQRPECGKFILPERTGRKKYCSNLCCSLDHENKKPREERTDYAWLHRLEKKPLGVLRTKTGKPAARKRLHDIEARWPNLAEKVRAIRARI